MMTVFRRSASSRNRADPQITTKKTTPYEYNFSWILKKFVLWLVLDLSIFLLQYRFVEMNMTELNEYHNGFLLDLMMTPRFLNVFDFIDFVFWL